ncbi:MAG: hypothetical protein RIE77_09370 [Phycisphaerales bacterium]|jgi:hypothetical protein
MRYLALCAGAVAGFSAMAAADPIGLVLEPSPDMTVFSTLVEYDADLDLLSIATTDVSGVTLFDTSGTSPVVGFNPIFDPEINIDVSVDDSGIASGARLSISGSFIDGGRIETLLTGEGVIDFGSSGRTGVLELIIGTTGGTLSGLYGDQIGIIAGTDGTFGGSFDRNFRTTAGLADIGRPVPAPASLAVLGAGLLAARRRRR